MNKYNYHKDFKITSLKGMDLKGSVKSIFEYLVDSNKRQLRNYYLFNENGYLIQQKVIDDELQVTIENRKYVDSNLVSVEEIVYIDDEIIETSKEVIDGDSVHEEYCKFENHVAVFHSIIEYKKEVKYDDEGFMIENLRRYTNGDIGKDMYLFNNDSLKIKSGKSYFQGVCYNRNEDSEIIFNKDGLIIEEIRGDGRTKYSYNGNSLREIKNTMHEFGETTLFIDTYNDDGRCIKSEYNTYLKTSKNFEYEMPEYCSVTFHRYENDEHGNWIKKIDTCNHKQVIHERIIDYF